MINATQATNKTSENKVLNKLWDIIKKKKTILCVSLDLTKKSQLLNMCDLLGPHTHIDIVDDFDEDLVSQLIKLSTKHQFLIFEDRKFADIGNTVKHQFGGGIYRISEWADIINCHILPGEGVIEGLKTVLKTNKKDSSLLLIYEMSSNKDLFNEAYQRTCLEWAEKHKDFVIGFISGHKPNTVSKTFLTLTPGISLSSQRDNLGQLYKTPFDAVCSDGSDIIIVGRAITGAADPLNEAIKYKQVSWDACTKFLNK